MISSFIDAGPDAAQRDALRGASRVHPRTTATTPARRIAARALHRWASTLDPAGARGVARTPATTAALYRRAA